MRLHYQSKDGEQKSIELTEKPMTIGRSADADVMLLDEKASRVHCGIRFWDGEFYIKDLKSKNGTFVNEQKIDIHQLATGDRIRIGASTFAFEKSEEDTGPGANTAILEMQGAYDGGKGYSTILREIVEETDEPPTTPLPRASTEPEEPSESPEEGGDTDEGDVLDRPTVPESARKKVVRKKKAVGAKWSKDSSGAGKPVTRIKVKRPDTPPSE